MLVLFLDATDQIDVAHEPLVGPTPLVSVQLRKECVCVRCHPVSVAFAEPIHEVTGVACGDNRRLRQSVLESYPEKMSPHGREDADQRSKPTPVVSLRGREGQIVEMLFRPDLGETRLVSWDVGEFDEHEVLSLDGGDYVPYSSKNNLLTHRVLLLASDVGSYTSVEELLSDVRSFIHRYVDVSDGFEEIAAHYVLLTWVYDRFNELPYLRVRGDYGSGKSRFLLTVGSICWKPIFASGASTVSPIFRLIDQVGGTLVVDEADFWASDERAEIVKILNNGNARGFPVLRSEVTPQKEFSPRAFNIFGPKLVATRHDFEDEALESRCLTEQLGIRSLRKGIPISLPDSFEAEAQGLRNKLLRYRFEHATRRQDAALSGSELEPRRLQILAPMLQVAVTDDARERMRSFVSGEKNGRPHRLKITQALMSAIVELSNEGQALSVGAIAERLRQHLGSSVSDRWVGSMLRGVGLETQKSNGVYRIPQDGRVEEVLRRYGITAQDSGSATNSEQE